MVKASNAIRLFAMTLLVLFAHASWGAVITNDEVKKSVLANFPLIKKSELELRAADGKALASRGFFDTKIKVKAANRYDDVYDYRDLDTRLEKQLPFSGLKVFGGHHQGLGEIPAYTGKYETAPRGELFLGARLPLLRGRSIDEPRFERAEAENLKRIAESELVIQRNYYLFKALLAYEKWVLSHRKLNVRKQLLEIATTRQKMLDRQASLGDVERVAVTDGRRSLLKRQSDELEAVNELRNAKTEMSLYLRDKDGKQIDLSDKEPQATLVTKRQFAKLAFPEKKIPQISVLENARSIQSAAVELGKNYRLPTLDVEATQFRTLPRDGQPDTTRLQVGLVFEFPLENRKGRGETRAATSKMEAVERQMQFATSEINARVSQLSETMKALEKRLELLNEELKSANIVSDAERRRWRSGDSNLFLVASREEEAANVEVRLWTADFEFAAAEAEARYITSNLAD